MIREGGGGRGGGGRGRGRKLPQESGGCGPVVRLLGCHTRAQWLVPHCTESGI